MRRVWYHRLMTAAASEVKLLLVMAYVSITKASAHTTSS